MESVGLVICEAKSEIIWECALVKISCFFFLLGTPKPLIQYVVTFGSRASMPNLSTFTLYRASCWALPVSASISPSWLAE